MPDAVEAKANRATGSAKAERTGWNLTRRAIQIALGAIWLLDGLLKFQPRLWHAGFVNSVISPQADGQPAPLAWLITHMATFLGHGQAVWVTFFGLLEIAIGLGLFFKRTVKVALFISILWAAGIWLFGEGLGGVLTGQVSPLMGAPGAAYLYGILAALVWPVPEKHGTVVSSGHARSPRGLASSAIGSGRFGLAGGLGVWAVIWTLEGLLWLFPVNRASSSIDTQLSAMGPGEPGWYAHALSSLGNAFAGAGVPVAVVLCVLSLMVAFGPLVSRRPQRFIVLGMVIALLYWVSGEGFGELMTLTGTDPSNGPLMILFGFGLLPTVPQDENAEALLTPLFRRQRERVSVAVVALALVPITIGLLPASASSSTSSSSEMAMSMTSVEGSSSTSTTCTAHQSGMRMSGLDLANTPYMVMSGNLGMDMNGADASAAAGLNTTKPNWHYVGPALPTATADKLLSQGGNGLNDIHMAVTGCAASLTSSEQIEATQYVQATTQAVTRYEDPAPALAAGYVAVSPSSYPVVYYVNPAIEAANAVAKRTLNPQHVDGLVYARTPSGAVVLVAAMYLLPNSVTSPPMPYGALVQWHQRTDVCTPSGASTIGRLDITGVTPCSAGSVKHATPYMTMVWQVPVAGGPLAIQPPDIQIVEAAVMAEGDS